LLPRRLGARCARSDRGWNEEDGNMTALDLEAFRDQPLVRDPFEYLILPGFVKPEARAAIHADYPQVAKPGSFPLSEVSYGPAFGALVEELCGPPMRAAFEDKFHIDLNGRPTMITVRGRCGEKDGNIHTDSLSKLITVLIYMNPKWEQAGGRLRLLRSADDLYDVIAEIPPEEGTLVAFRRSHNSYHGHKPFIGPRRVIQLNWVTDQKVLRFEATRHRFSAFIKRMVPKAS
jgi:SM-20-related protein